MMFGDLILILSILVALWYVPRYLWRVYGGPDIGGWIVKYYQVVMSRPAPPAPAQTTDRQADRPSVSADDLEVGRLQLDRTKVAVIEVMVYNGWQVGEIRAVIKGDNGAIGAEVEAAKKRLGIDTPEPRTPIAGRPTAAQFASDREAA